MKNLLIAVLLTAMFVLNKNVFSVQTEGYLNLFVTGYLDDIAAPCLIFASCDILLGTMRMKMLGFPLITLSALCVGAFWECFSPVVRPYAVFDPLDFLAYFAGGVIYWLICGRDDPYPAELI
ncbi:MAG: hypothetical protein ACOYJH_03250 [Anaerovoracaceae bacterium]|jgi:hypothetical protein